MNATADAPGSPSAGDVQAEIDQLRALGERQWAYENQVINLIASDNALPRAYTSQPVYPGHMIQEGLTGRRPFAGAALHDEIESFAEVIASRVFAVESANLQPHSCSQANQAAYHALLAPGDRVLSLDFLAGGHLTHGLRINFSGQMYRFEHYGVGDDDLIDYDALEAMAVREPPKLIVCGSSSYPRLFDAERLRDIADATGAKLMFDLSHEAGLIASGAIPNPAPLADVVTMSLDKTLRGPFGAVILSRADIADAVARAVHPGTQSSFSVRRIADSAHALLLTQTPAFRAYGRQVIANAQAMAARLLESGVPLVTGGTDKHYLVMDVGARFDLTGRAAEERLESLLILTSRQSLPRDPSARMSAANGLRLGAAWATSRGYVETDFREIADVIVAALGAPAAGRPLDSVRERVAALAGAQRPNDVWRVTAEGDGAAG